MASKTFLASSNSSGGINPAASAKARHSSICSGLAQYESHCFLLRHAGGLIPFSIAALTFFASSNSLGGKILFCSAKATHSFILSILSQYFSHSSLPLHPPGPLPPPAINFLAISISSCGIMLFFSAKAMQASKF